MTIEGIPFNWTIHCDACPNYLEAEVESFKDAVDELHRNGWKASKNEAGWFHLCPVCLEKGKNKNV